MSSLARYKKTGGFLQLLSLIETFAPTKKDKFIEMIEAESAVWAQALRDRMLTIERIFSWPDQTMIEVFKNMQTKNLAYALEGLKPEQKARVLTYFSAAEKRRLDDILFESTPKPAEVAATLVKVVETARKMLQERVLHSDKFDAALTIPEDLEAQLEAASHGLAPSKASPSPAPAPHPSHSGQTTSLYSGKDMSEHEVASSQASGDVGQLQRTLGLIAKENKMLKDENRALRERLEQIKKLSAA